MKKTIAILLVQAVVMTGVFAANENAANVTLNASVKSETYIPTLYYKGASLVDGAAIFSDGVDGSSMWDLASTTPVTTDVFSVQVSGNENVSRYLKVTVKPGDFIATVDGVNHPANITITPEATNGVINDATGNKINAGKQSGAELCTFTLGWTGDANLPAGDYTSTVQIGYTVE